MTSQLDNSSIVVGGVDTHKDLHVSAVVDHYDRLLGSASFPTTGHVNRPECSRHPPAS